MKMLQYDRNHVSEGIEINKAHCIKSLIPQTLEYYGKVKKTK